MVDRLLAVAAQQQLRSVSAAQVFLDAASYENQQLLEHDRLSDHELEQRWRLAATAAALPNWLVRVRNRVLRLGNAWEW